MGASLFSIGLTGLNAAQAGLQTTSHNISNAGTAGYSRQRIEQSTNPAMFTGAGFFGEGTRVDTVKRAYNNFLTNQVLAADTRFNEYDTFATEIGQIDNMLSDPTVGLSPALADFFSGVQEVAANPASIPARQSMLSTGESLVARFHNLSDRLNEIRSGIEGQIKETVSQIGTYAVNIAEVNDKITVAQQAGASQPANDLLDTRDRLVKELNQLVRVSTHTDADGTMSVFIGTGQPLVIGTHPTRLEALPSVADQSRLDVNILTQNGGAIAIPESLMGGGKLGGLLNMRASALDSAQNQIGLLAVGMSTAFNAQHQLGQDLNGKLGTDFFTTPSVSVQRYANATTSMPDVQYGDVSKLVGEDYRPPSAPADPVQALADHLRFLADTTAVADEDPVELQQLEWLGIALPGALLHPTLPAFIRIRFRNDVLRGRGKDAEKAAGALPGLTLTGSAGDDAVLAAAIRQWYLEVNGGINAATLTRWAVLEGWYLPADPAEYGDGGWLWLQKQLAETEGDSDGEKLAQILRGWTPCPVVSPGDPNEHDQLVAEIGRRHNISLRGPRTDASVRHFGGATATPPGTIR